MRLPRARSWLVMIPLALAAVLAVQLFSRGQQSGEKGGENSDRLQFEIVHSFDGKYLGDTPGHMGRIGGLGTRRPRIALGDYVFRGDERIGTVTSLEWNRTNTSLDIEFDPEPKVRIFIGDTAWVQIEPVAATKSK